MQHHAAEHPGVFRDYLAADGIGWDAVQLQDDESLPSLDGYDAVWVMGGPMDVWQEDIYPWLRPEKALIEEAVFARGLPFLGCCLGHQLLGEVADGVCGAMTTPEVGVYAVELTDAARNDTLLAGCEPRFEALQWHGAAVTEVPGNVEVLAQSPACAIQAIRVGERAWGLQYHIEATATTVGEWGAVPAYAKALEQALGPDALPGLDAAVAERLPTFNAAAHRLYRNFMAAVPQR
ncbi:MAG: type 1 glutamine amidotransferase [Halofilum sp. (in: g-proteobacteria)]